MFAHRHLVPHVGAAQISSYALHTAVEGRPFNPSVPRQVLSIEKAESTHLLPNPIIVSLRTKKAFQLIELQDRDQLVDSLNVRLRSMQWRRSMFRSKKGSKKAAVSLLHGWLKRSRAVLE